MAQNFVYEGDMPEIICDCGVDVTTASARTIEYQKPDGTTDSWTAAASGTNAIKYDVPNTTTLIGAGEWRLQPKVTIAGKEYRGRTATLDVRRPFA